MKIRSIHLIAGFSVFAVLGMVFATYLILLSQGVTTGEFCSISETVNCNTVSQSKYANLLGIPVSWYGLVTYALMLIGLWVHWFTKNETVLMLVGTLTLIALAFSLYLTGIEAFVIHAWCLLCIGSQVAVLGMVATYFGYRKLES